MIDSLSTTHPYYGIITSIGSVLLFVFVMISLVILYIFKLIQFLRSYKIESNMSLVNEITKTILLTSTSIIVTLFNVVLVIIYANNTNNITISWIQTYVTLFDIYTNFLCFFLHSKKFKRWYSYCCSFIHKRCGKCWFNIVVNSNANNLDITFGLGASRTNNTKKGIYSDNEFGNDGRTELTQTKNLTVNYTRDNSRRFPMPSIGMIELSELKEKEISNTGAINVSMIPPLNNTLVLSITKSDYDGDDDDEIVEKYTKQKIKQKLRFKNIQFKSTKSIESKQSIHEQFRFLYKYVSNRNMSHCLLYRYELDIFHGLNPMNDGDVMEILLNKPMLFDALIKVHSMDFTKYIDVAVILTEDCLYFISAINYQTWKEFENRTKIDVLIKNDSIMIDDELAMELTNNLDIVDDDKINNSTIKPYLIGKTKNQIQLNILLHKDQMLSLITLFDIKKGTKMKVKKKKHVLKTIKYIIINDFFNEEVIDQQKTSDFVDCILNDIVWIEEDQQNYSKILELKDYHSTSIISLLNKRKRKYCQRNKISDMFLEIAEYSEYKIKNTCSQIYSIEVNQYEEVQPLDLDIGYGLELHSDSKSNNIKCNLWSNNKRHAFISHLDYIINYREPIEIDIIEGNVFHVKNNSIILKLMNNFADEQIDDNEDEEQFSSKFSFGEYLNYWQSGYENSVIPIYPTLKQELLKNKIAVISENQYYRLYIRCKDLLPMASKKMNAQDIGINNKNFNIPKGTPVTINHLISLKLYTDYSKIQNEFKKHCRKYNANESLKNFIRRNAEIAHWCRYLKECCTFYGRTMDKNMIVYTGLSVKLLFDSMKTHFECPLSTTTEMNVANSFSEGVGVMLKLQAANPKTRYIDVSSLSRFPHEHERLFMGSSLKICDIYISTKTTKGYISAIQMFEQIITGQFIDRIQTKTEYALYALMNFVMTSRDPSDPKKTIVDSITEYVENDQYVSNTDSMAFNSFLNNEEYDTECIKEDLDDHICSNILQIMEHGNSVNVIRRYLDMLDKRYIVALFENMIDRMIVMHESNALYINESELRKIKRSDLRDLLIETGGFFSYCGINVSEIERLNQYEWSIEKSEYGEFENMKAKQYIKSKEYECNIKDNNDEDQKVSFHLECCCKYTEESEKVGLFFCLDALPTNIEAIRIEYDIMCEKKTKYRHQMTPQWLSPYYHTGFKQDCGFQTFSSKSLGNNDAIKWMIGLKIIDKRYSNEEIDKSDQGEIYNESTFNTCNVPKLLLNYGSSNYDFPQNVGDESPSPPPGILYEKEEQTQTHHLTENSIFIDKFDDHDVIAQTPEPVANNNTENDTDDCMDIVDAKYDNEAAEMTKSELQTSVDITPETSPHHTSTFNKDTIPKLSINNQTIDIDEELTEPITPIDDDIEIDKAKQSDEMMDIIPVLYMNKSTAL